MISKTKLLLWITFILSGILIINGCIQRKSDDGFGRKPDNKRQNQFFSGNYIPDIETFMQIGYVSDPDISVDGRWIFFSPSFTNTTQLFRNAAGSWPYQLTAFEDGITWYELSHDSYYAIVGAAHAGDENSQMYLLDTEGGRVRQLTHDPKIRYGSVIWSHDDKTIYFASNAKNDVDFMIYRLSLPDGIPELIQEKKGMNGPAGITRDGRFLLTYTYHTSRNSNYYLYNLETHEEQCLTPHQGDYLYEKFVLTPDQKNGYCLTNNTSDGVTRLVRVDLATKEHAFLEPLQKWEVEDLRLSNDGHYLLWLLNEEGYARPFARNLQTGRMIPLPSLKGMYGLGGITADGKFLFSFNSTNHAPYLWLWNPDKESLTQITHVSTMGIDVSQFVEPQLIKYKSFDSLEIPAFLYLPKEYTGGPIPFILDVHGGPEGQAHPEFNRHFNYLLANGFGLLAPNVRGSTGYGKKYLDLDNYRNRLNSVADAAWGVKWLINNGYTKPDRVGVKGASYGGYMTMALITEYPDLFAAAWDQVGIVNFVTFLQKTAAYRTSLRESEYGPLSDTAFLKSISPIYKVDKIKCPLMVVHGENDPRVPIGEARQIISELKKRGGVVDSLIFADEGHGIEKMQNRLESYRKMVDFFTKYLKK